MATGNLFRLLSVLVCGSFLIISWRARGKAAVDFKHYAIGGGGFSFALIFFTQFATIMGAGNFFGHAGSAYEAGLPWLAYIAGEQGAKILFALVFAGAAGAFTYNSLPEMLDDLVIRDRPTRTATAILVSLLLVAMIGGQSKALGLIFETFTGADSRPFIIGFSVVFVIYTCMGGIYSVIWTDFLQGIVCSVAAVAFYLFAFRNVDFSLVTLGRSLGEVGKAELWSFSSASAASMVNRFLTGTIGILVSQVIWQRCFASKSGKTAKRALLYSGGVCLAMTMLTALVGLIIMTLNQNLDANTAMTWFMKECMPPAMATCVFLLVLCAGMSTADSALNACSIVLVNDVIHPYFPALDDRALVRLAKLVTVVVGALACAAGILSSSIYSLIAGSNSIAGSALAPLVCVGMLWKGRGGERGLRGACSGRVSAWGARASLAVGFVAALLPFGRAGATIRGVVLGTLTLVIVSALTNRREAEKQIK